MCPAISPVPTRRHTVIATLPTTFPVLQSHPHDQFVTANSYLLIPSPLPEPPTLLPSGIIFGICGSVSVWFVCLVWSLDSAHEWDRVGFVFPCLTISLSVTPRGPSVLWQVPRPLLSQLYLALSTPTAPHLCEGIITAPKNLSNKVFCFFLSADLGLLATNALSFCLCEKVFL